MNDPGLYPITWVGSDSEVVLAGKSLYQLSVIVLPI
jgi:hypothetical protein